MSRNQEELVADMGAIILAKFCGIEIPIGPSDSAPNLNIYVRDKAVCKALAVEATNYREEVFKVPVPASTFEMFERLSLRTLNQVKLSEEKERLYQMLWEVVRKIRYQKADNSDLRVIYQQMFALDKESRDQDVTCWKDMVMVSQLRLSVCLERFALGRESRRKLRYSLSEHP